MKCPSCNSENDRVLDTRVQKDGSIKRRRECMSCKWRFSTAEFIIANFPSIIKKDGRREPFNQEKVLKGLQAATQKRPIGRAQLDGIVEKISNWLLHRTDSEISSQMIGQKLMAELKRLDDVAYVRFASVYRSFRDVQEFVETLEDDPVLEGIPIEDPGASFIAKLTTESAGEIASDSKADLNGENIATSNVELQSEQA